MYSSRLFLIEKISMLGNFELFWSREGALDRGQFDLIVKLPEPCA